MVNQKITRQSFVGTIYDIVIKQTKNIIYVVCLVGISVTLFFGHKFWVKQKNKLAQRDFGMLMYEYHKVAREKNPEWSVLLEKLKNGYEQHKNSLFAPYYVSYQVNILLQQNKHDDALVLLNNLTSEFDKSPLKSLYSMEKSLVTLDSNNDQEHRKAIDDLIVLANDAQNDFRDIAMFYLGRYYWVHDQIDLARDIWQRLVDEQRDEKIAPSPWADQVKDYLTLTVV